MLLAIACAMALMPAMAALSQDMNTMNIRFTIDGKELVTATLMDNATARDFLALLPITLTLEDHAGTEKISYLPRKLSTAGAPAGSDPSVGDIAYYAPWGNLAIFYKDFGYSRGFVLLGRIDSSIEAFRVAGRPKVTIERVR
ncbi:MAG: cyclophilin [Rhodospirillales bacterium]|nr:cyclophilin [Rhodospirillales bacterium]